MPIITNKMNLPQALVDYVKESEYSPTEKHYSVTTILKGVRETLLSRRHYNEIEVDVNEKINMLFGTAVHHILEQFDKTGYAEIYFKEKIMDGYYLSGKLDLYNPIDFTVEDWKTATTYKVLKEDFEDWRKQGLMYAWLCFRQGKHVGEIKFHALLKDWSAKQLRLAKLKGEKYPEAQVFTWKHTVTVADLKEIEEFIIERFKQLIAGEKLTDDQLPSCTNEETWYTGDEYAIIKNGSTRATRKFSTKQECDDYFLNQIKDKQNYHIEKRMGEHRKCQDYCAYCKFCKYYEERKAKENE